MATVHSPKPASSKVRVKRPTSWTSADVVLVDSLQQVTNPVPPEPVKEPRNPFRNTIGSLPGGQSQRLSYPANHSYRNQYLIQLNLGSGGLNCCGMGVLGGFYTYFQHPDAADFTLPTAAEILAYVRELMAAGSFYAEMIGIMNHDQWRAREFFEVLFPLEDVHQTTNKNHGGVAPMHLIKINREQVHHRWAKVEGEGYKLYREWVAKRYPNYNGAV